MNYCYHNATTIYGFDHSDDFAFLSNFWPCPIVYNGLPFLNTEAAYQAQKSDDVEIRRLFCKLPPAPAKALGRRVEMRPDWETVKVDVMRDVLRLKFAPGTDLRQRLDATAPRVLIEGNVWGDRIWGQVDHVGQNLLGKLLMEIRDDRCHSFSASYGNRDYCSVCGNQRDVHVT